MPKSTLSDTARVVLNTACDHPDRLAFLPAHLPAAAKRAVVRSLLKAGLLQEVLAESGQPFWRMTNAGLLAIGSGFAAPGGDAPGQTDAVPQAKPRFGWRETVRRSVEAVTAAWDDDFVNTHPALASAIASLRNALVSQRPTSTVSGGPSQPRRDTKRVLVPGLLLRPEGTTVAQVGEATGWARHTVHGFFEGLKKSGTSVKVLERVRQVGPGKQVGRATTFSTARRRPANACQTKCIPRRHRAVPGADPRAGLERAWAESTAGERAPVPRPRNGRWSPSSAMWLAVRTINGPVSRLPWPDASSLGRCWRGRAARPHQSACSHALAVAGRRLLGAGRGYARRR